MRIRTVAAALAAALSAVAAFAGEPPLAPQALAGMQSAHMAPRVVDVRTAEEYRDGHIPGALNVPYDQIAARADALDVARDAPVVVYCRTGKRAAIAQHTLEGLGYTHVRLLDGSFQAWQAARLPVVREAPSR
ncbi:phage shock protein E [Mizugakiibacter sediminis]|uniref:Phage shock protein E n=1 Tax=Mizugakiibacter sediminis TaxID=1475481 RepID=A0A0K8QN01_9GAMM|nr:rhodanese-like domain-containing protein [Mizugakiibacter sediminis]GAP66238.1 phage shock protein E [Mizugakiibacter sediminis]